MSRTPEPRPALKRAADGGLHPAAPKAVPPKHLHSAPHAPAVPAPEVVVSDEPVVRFKPGDLRARKAAAAGGGGKQGKKEEMAPLDVQVPKKLRKAVRRRAEDEGLTTQDAVTLVLRAWVES